MQCEPPSAESPKPKRRWFQFSLRTLLIVVALLAVPLGYVGWQAKIVRERKAMVREVAKMGGQVVFSSYETKLGPDSHFRFGETTMKPPYPTVSTLRAWLGDDFALGIALPAATPTDTLKRVEQIFPEAKVAKRRLLKPPYFFLISRLFT
jgi:hypothetical protein